MFACHSFPIRMVRTHKIIWKDKDMRITKQVIYDKALCFESEFFDEMGKLCKLPEGYTYVVNKNEDSNVFKITSVYENPVHNENYEN
jgi:hypothetical protein